MAEATMSSDDLAVLLKRYGWTQQDAARTIGIGKRTLGYYLAGRRIPEPVAFAARTKLVRQVEASRW